MSDIVERLVALANSLGGTEEDDIMSGVAEIERLRAALRDAAIFLETAAPFLPDDVTVRHSFNNGETLQTRPLSVVLRACAKDARRAATRSGVGMLRRHRMKVSKA